MTPKERIDHIKFIESDTKKKGEKIVSGITFFAGIYSLRININGKNRKVSYSAAENCLSGYRPIKLISIHRTF